MDKPPLWAPWRMEYILGAKPQGCIFCELPTRSPAAYREGLVLLVQEHAFVCLNRYPFAASHLLVVPRRHIGSFDELPEGEWIALMELVRASAARLKEATDAEALNVGFNVGKAAGAGIAEHLHAHAVPRWTGDTNFMPVLGDVRVMPEHLDDSWRRLYPHFADLQGVRAPPPVAEAARSADGEGRPPT